MDREEEGERLLEREEEGEWLLERDEEGEWLLERDEEGEWLLDREEGEWWLFEEGGGGVLEGEREAIDEKEGDVGGAEEMARSGSPPLEGRHTD